MDEKQPTFTVTDRRKFTLDGEFRDDAATTEGRNAADRFESAASDAPKAVSDNVLTMPSPEHRGGTSESAADAPVASEEPGEEEESLGDSELPQFSAKETAEQHAAYEQSSRQLDDMLSQANPGMAPAGAVTFEHIIQSFYVSAMIAMGAGTEPGQKPRVDILGARQSIDMLSLLQEKTKGNLSQREEATLQNVVFELRMMFLEITNAISQAATRPGNGQRN